MDVSLPLEAANPEDVHWDPTSDANVQAGTTTTFWKVSMKARLWDLN